MGIKLTGQSGAVDLSQKMWKGDPGGYYVPDVNEEGVLTWTPTDEDMPAVEGDNIKGPQGEKGDSGVWKDSTTPPEGYDVWIDPSGGASNVATVEYVDKAIEEIELTPGPQGEPGPQGPKGEDGTDGLDGYTPVKGVDYWTEEDQTQIVNDVLNSLPAAEGVAV